jgi:hypothetical protein
MGYIIAILVGSSVALGCILIDAFIHGLVLSKLWAWFVVSFIGLPHLSLWQAYGIFLVFSALMPHPVANTCKDERTAEEKIAFVAVRMLGTFLLLLMGWLVKTFFL